MFEFLRNLNLLTKFQIAFSLVATISLSAIGVVSYYEGKNILTEKAFNLLFQITENKKKAIELYFQNIRNQVLVFAENPVTAEALSAFSTAFQTLSSEISEKQIIESQQNVNSFYTQEFLPKLRYNSLNDVPLGKYLPKQRSAIKLQNDYIAANPNPIEFKYLLNTSADNHSYDKAHQKYHPLFTNLLLKFQLYDILMIDAKGTVVYTTIKESDFGTDILKGAYKNSNLARLYRRIMKSGKKGTAFFEDYANYEASYFIPASFVGSPVFQNGKIIGALIFQVSTDKINEIMTNSKQWEKDGLGKSGEVNMVAGDYKLRTNTRSILTNPLDYTTRLKKSGKVDSVTVEKIRRLNTTILLREYRVKATINALNGKTGKELNIDFNNNVVLDVYMPVDILGVRWAIITEIDGEEIFADVEKFRSKLIIISIIIFLGISLVAYLLARSLSRPMLKIERSITQLATGQFPPLTQKIYKDEIGKINASINSLIISMREASFFADSIGKGNFNYQFELRNQGDILGLALINMRNNLLKVQQEEQIRNWTNTGAALFGEILRTHSNNLEELSKNLIAELIKYLKAAQGALFLADDTQPHLTMVSCYAFDKLRSVKKTIQIGEGIVGQAFQERDKIYLTEVPENYTEIGSGLGSAKPRCILVVPLKTGDQIFGILEIASFELLKDYEISFIESIAEDTAVTIATVKMNGETQKLLQEAQLTAKALRQQEEELRRNYIELQIAQEEVKLKEQKNEQIIKELNEKFEEQMKAMAQKENEIEMQKEALQRALEETEKQNKLLLKRDKTIEKAIKRFTFRDKKLRDKIKYLQAELSKYTGEIYISENNESNEV
ncbi:MAG: GAF domain-containing protein [Microscillaceae bacterium]|nr:GAF domain-containing protein [Microscillaceae bacterium]MDW8461984.1 GAF domain-containing protein [Cytophagales bacterium]